MKGRKSVLIAARLCDNAERFDKHTDLYEFCFDRKEDSRSEKQYDQNVAVEQLAQRVDHVCNKICEQ